MRVHWSHNVPLDSLTTLELGGRATLFAEAHREQDVASVCEQADARGLTLFVLGGGSNVVVADDGFDGAVLGMRIRGVRFEHDGQDTLVQVGAGEPWDDLVASCVTQRLAGLECLSGIPGSTGATPIQNVGAYGQEVAETIVAVRAFDREHGEFVSIDASACAFGYRDSMFKRCPGRYVVVRVDFRLRRHGAPTLRYAELRRALESGSPSLADVREAVLELRRRKSMVIDPGDPNRRSAGSFFTNPILPANEASEVFARAVRLGDAAHLDDIPHWPLDGGKVKLAAAWLIERAGFTKGHDGGSVGLSTRHALAVVHRGGGSTRRLLEFVHEIRARVYERYAVELVPEPVLLGCTLRPLS